MEEKTNERNKMNNKTNTNIWKEHLVGVNPEKGNNPLILVQEEVKQQFDELLESRDNFLDELDDFTKMIESLYEVGKDFTYEDLKLGSFGDSRITDEEKMFIRSLPSRPDLWNGWKRFVDHLKEKIDLRLNTIYRVFLEDNKLRGKYGLDFMEKGTINW